MTTAAPDAPASSSADVAVEVLSVGDILAIAFECGYVQYRPMVSSTLYFEQKDPPSVQNDDGTTTTATPVKINVYYTTRSIMTYLPHPTRGINQMWRSGAYRTADELRNLFLDPRQHTNIGYRNADKAKRGCAGCGELKTREEYSQNQWKLGPDANRCKDCVRTGRGKGGGTASATTDEVSDLADDMGTMRLTSDALEEHDAKIRKEEEQDQSKGGKNKKKGGNKNKAVRDDLERRQFNCPRCPKEGRGPHVFFKKVPKYKPMVKCPRCKRATRGKCRRILAVPRDAERGYGFFRCRKCSDSWGSSRAVGGVGQECYSCRNKGDEGVMVVPFRIEVHQHKKKRGGRGFASGPRSGMRRVPRNPIGEDAPAEHGYEASGGDQALFPDSAHSRSYDYEPRQTSADGAGSEAGNGTPGFSTKPSGYKHRCAGCASGICRNRRVPKSQVHDVSDGDTASTRSSIVTNSSVDKSDFLDRDEDFSAFEVDN